MFKNVQIKKCAKMFKFYYVQKCSNILCSKMFKLKNVQKYSEKFNLPMNGKSALIKSKLLQNCIFKNER